MSVFKKEKYIKLSQEDKKIIYIGEGPQPLFKENLTGAQVAQLALAPTTDDFAKLIMKSLENRGFDKTKKYSPAEIKIFTDGVYQDLYEKMGGILDLVNK